MTRTAALLSLVAVLASPGPTFAGEPFVYVSPDGSGAQPAVDPYGIPFADGLELELFIGYDPPSTGSGITMCVDVTSDETCGFDVRLVMSTDTARFTGFAPASGNIVGNVATPTTLLVNGVDTNGMPNPAPIGTLMLDAAGANAIRIDVVGNHRVGAAGQLEAIQSRVIVPEPGWLPQLVGGLLLLGWLSRRRARASPLR